MSLAVGFGVAKAEASPNVSLSLLPGNLDVELSATSVHVSLP